MSPANGRAWLGIDIGTQSVRAVVVTSDGWLLGDGTASLAGRRRGERHEQDPEQWWRAVGVAARRAADNGADLASVAGIAVDATSGSFVLTDPSGTTTTPGIMYDDGRAHADLARVNTVGAEAWARAGYRRMQRSWALPKLVNLLGEHPEATRAHWRLSHQVDLVNQRLIGHPVPTDTSTALKTGADAATAAWPRAVLDELGVPADMLPELVVPGTVLGDVCRDAARATGLRAGTPVVAGMTDGCAAQLGSGATGLGSWNSVLGTTLVLKGVSASPVSDPGGVVYSHRLPNGRWLPGGASSVGAGLVGREFPDSDLPLLSAEAEPLLPSDLIRYPLLSCGERFPFVAPEAVGFSSRKATSAAESFAALLQGVAYVERLCFDYLSYLEAPTDGDIVLTGGATRNETWNQLRADVLGREVLLPRNTEPALGMAVLARSALEQQDLEGVAAEMIRVERALEPRSALTSAHVDGYRRLVAELAERGWLPRDVAEHAQGRSDP